MRKLLAGLLAFSMLFGCIGLGAAEEMDDIDEEEMAELEGEDGGSDMLLFSSELTMPDDEAEDEAEAEAADEETDEAEDAEEAVDEAAPAPAPAAPAADGEVVPWTFGVSLSGLNQKFLILPTEDAPLGDGENYVPENMDTLRARINNDDGTNANGGINFAVSGKLQLMNSAANALAKMFNAAEQDKMDLYIRSGWRSTSDQKKRYTRAQKQGDNEEPAPGLSDFQTGLAATVVNYDLRGQTLSVSLYDNTPEAAWLKKNMARFGFIIRYPQGKENITGHAYTPWHLRYVGTEPAKYMAEHDLCLEEFLAEVDAAYADFAARGGNVEAAIAASILPEGPLQLSELGPDGDAEIILFHD